MSQIDRLHLANEEYRHTHVHVDDARPSRHMAVLTCMDARIDVFAVLGLRSGEAHVLRNAGARVTDDVLRSLAVSTHALAVDTLVVMQHTGCGLVGVSDEELQRMTDSDLTFLTIDEHAAALRHDVDVLVSMPYLEPLQSIAGLVYEIETGALDEIVRWERPA